MTAMDNASRNAGEVIKKLTLQMNRSRQASITKELDRDHLRRRSRLRIQGKGTFMATNNIGTITQITGAVVDVRFEGELPNILNALHVEHRRPQAGARGGAASGRVGGPRHRDGHDRRPGARREGGRHRRPDRHAGRPRDARPHPQRDRRAGRRARPGRRQADPADPSRGARVRRAVDGSARSWSPASRSSTCWRPTPRAARSACSAAPASARP